MGHRFNLGQELRSQWYYAVWSKILKRKRKISMVRTILETTLKAVNEGASAKNRFGDSSQARPPGLIPTPPPPPPLPHPASTQLRWLRLRPQPRSPLHFDLSLMWSLAPLEVLLSWPTPGRHLYFPALSQCLQHLAYTSTPPQPTAVWPSWQLVISHMSVWFHSQGQLSWTCTLGDVSLIWAFRLFCCCLWFSIEISISFFWIYYSKKESLCKL